jgi:hypothetical protein
LITNPPGSGAGPLQGLYNWFGFYFFDNAVIGAAGNHFIYDDGTQIADLFYDAQVTIYDNASSVYCSLQWFSPTEWVLNSLNQFMFRSALSSSNSSDVQSFTVQRTNPTLVYHSDHRYLVAALVFSLVALVAVLFLLWGYWEIGRYVSLSPIETAKAFQAQIMQDVQEVSIDGILKEVGKLSVRFDKATGTIVCDDLDTTPPGARVSDEAACLIRGEGRLSGDSRSIQAAVSENERVAIDEDSPLSKETEVVHIADEIEDVGLRESDTEQQ